MAACEVEEKGIIHSKRMRNNVHILPNVKNSFSFTKKLSPHNENLPGSPTAYLFVLSSETNHH